MSYFTIKHACTHYLLGEVLGHVTHLRFKVLHVLYKDWRLLHSVIKNNTPSDSQL